VDLSNSTAFRANSISFTNYRRNHGDEVRAALAIPLESKGALTANIGLTWRVRHRQLLLRRERYLCGRSAFEPLRPR